MKKLTVFALTLILALMLTLMPFGTASFAYASSGEVFDPNTPSGSNDGFDPNTPSGSDDDFDPNTPSGSDDDFDLGWVEPRDIPFDLSVERNAEGSIDALCTRQLAPHTDDNGDTLYAIDPWLVKIMVDTVASTGAENVKYAFSLGNMNTAKLSGDAAVKLESGSIEVIGGAPFAVGLPGLGWLVQTEDGYAVVNSLSAPYEGDNLVDVEVGFDAESGKFSIGEDLSISLVDENGDKSAIF